MAKAKKVDFVEERAGLITALGEAEWEATLRRETLTKQLRALHERSAKQLLRKKRNR